ncbi:DNA-binding protein [Streptomyces sp. NRRL F-4489]|uniref:helix-turn-helix domain-containing protein n=1 Tax=Streptomyces sp. NRRL F-4489 TaxID=1609095 RepID=UPI0007490339|nr:helix-turn-helix transcriptional regulator [Streptomyces sp. NRRL F-4489]KUL35680.1 DNA-binding protein [Streptomyces sp. NRRL F-4489]
MPPVPSEHTGARVARLRQIHHLTQTGLAQRAHLSTSLVSKVEQGRAPASPAFIGAVARAMGLSTTDITGQPYIDELRADQIDTLIQPIREALDVYDLGPEPEIQPRSHIALNAEADQLCAMVRETNIKGAATDLPGLIHEATTAAYLAPSEAMWRTLASLYRTAYDIATKLGYADLATLALDRLEWAATRASDAVLGTLRQYLRGLAYLRSAQYSTGKRLVGMGLRTVEQAESGLLRDVVTGQLHLGAAILAARDRREDDVAGHLAEAQRIADRTGPVEQALWVSFGPANVALHRVAALAEMDRYPEAVRAARGVDLRTLPPSRIGHHHAEVARAEMWSGQPDAAYASLRRARAVAPQQTRYSPVVRQTMEDLTSHYRSVPDSFGNFARWIGM